MTVESINAQICAAATVRKLNIDGCFLGLRRFVVHCFARGLDDNIKFFRCNGF